MIILDTNVLSELMRVLPEERVIQWVDAQSSESLFTTAITQAEILYGVSILPDGKRKQALAEGVDAVFHDDFNRRVLPFDSQAAIEYAGICTDRTQLGRPISQFDAQIAAIARSRGSSLATRNTADFDNCGVTVFNPWQA